jgi:WD40 repeat protein
MGTVRWRHTGNVQSAIFSPDGKLIASTCSETDEVVWLWNVATGRLVRRIQLDGDTLVHGFIPDGKALLLEVGGVLALHDIVTGRQLRRFPKTKTNLRGVSLARDGKCLAYAADEPIVHVCDPVSGRERRQLKADDNSVMGVALSPDGKLLASVGRDNMLRLWDVASGKCLWTLWGDRPCDPAFAPNGRMLACGDARGAIRLVDVASGRILKSMRQYRAVPFLTFSSDGSLLVSGGDQIHLWNPATGTELPESKLLPIEDSHAVFAPDGKTLLLWSFKPTLRLWDVDHWHEKPPSPEGHEEVVKKIVAAPDGKSLLSMSREGTIRLWEMSEGRPEGCWPQMFRLEQSGAYPIAFAPDGETFAAGENRGIVQVRETKTGRLRRGWSMDEACILCLAFSADGRQLAVSGLIQVQIWDIDANKHLWQRPQKALPLLDDPTGPPRFHELFFAGRRPRVLSMAEHSLPILWDVESRDGRDIFGRNAWVIAALALSPDGRTLATRNHSIGDGIVQLWELTTYKERGRLSAKVNFDGPLAFAPDGRTLAATFPDGDIHLWSIVTGTELQYLRNRVPVTAMTFAPDGKSLVTAHTDTTILVWDVSAAAGRDDFADLPRVDPDKAWKALAGDADKAHRAIWQLTADPKRTVPFLADRLHAAMVPPCWKVQRWIAELDSDDFATRQRARKELEEHLETILEPLRSALRDKPSLEVRRRLELILDSARVCQRPLFGELLRSVRAVEVLEHIGTSEAQSVLKKLTAGAAGARLTEDAAAALVRLRRNVHK